MKNKYKNKLGFTLFELLVSISIIAVMTAIAGVSFGGMNKRVAMPEGRLIWKKSEWLWRRPNKSE